MRKGTDTKSRKRLLLPGGLVIIWFLLVAIGVPYFAKLSGLASTDLNTFLPKSAESSKVNTRLKDFNDQSAIPVVIVYEKHSGTLTSDDMQYLKNVNGSLAKVDGVNGKIGMPVESDDKQAAITVVPLRSDGDFKTIFKDLKAQLNDASLGITATFTGPASFAYDLQNGFSGIDGKLLVVTVSFVFLILLIVYRSPFLPFIVLGSALAALATAVFAVYHVADAGWVQMNAQVQGILFILVIGATTDYSLLYIARFREELVNHATTWRATLAALRSSYQAIIAAGGTVIVGLLCLLFSDLGSNKALGPVGSIGIGFSVLAAMSLLPALLLLFGRSVFWPRKPHYLQEKPDMHYAHNHPAWAKVGAFVRRHPRPIWMVCTVLLLAACLCVPQLKAEGVPQSDLVIGPSEARDGQKILDTHFPPGSGSPAYVIADQAQQAAVVQALDADAGVASVSLSVSGGTVDAIPVGKSAAKINDTVRKQAETMRDKRLAGLKASIQKAAANMPQKQVDAAYEKAAAQAPSLESFMALINPFRDMPAKVADGKVLLQAVLTKPADSLEARDTVTRLRAAVKKVDAGALIGGTSAAQLDTNSSSQRDIRVIMPLILVAITVILMLLLRAIVAPLVLLVSTILSFGATMGVSALVFNHLFHFQGTDPAVIILGFVFLVALGIDYNIFLMTRVREETAKDGVSKGTMKGLVVTGGVITSAGIVLAATFASLSVIPILFLVEIAFIVTFGVLLDTIVVRSLLVPAVTLTIGRAIWWPSRLSRGKK